MSSFNKYFGLCLLSLQLVNSFFLSKHARDVSSIRYIPDFHVLPIWADLGNVIAQLTLAPAAVYYIRNQMQEEVVVLNQRVVDMEESMQNSSLAYQKSQTDLSQTFANNMKSSVTTYQRLYTGINSKIDDVISNAERRSSFEVDLTASITELEGIANDILELKKGGKSSKLLIEKSLQNLMDETDKLKKLQSDQVENIEMGQIINDKERSLMRNAIQDSQNLAAMKMKETLSLFKSDIKEINIRTSNKIELNNARKIAYEIENQEKELRRIENEIRLREEAEEKLKNIDDNINKKNEKSSPPVDPIKFEKLNEKIKLLENIVSNQFSENNVMSELNLKIEYNAAKNTKINNKMLNKLKIFGNTLFSLEKVFEEDDFIERKERSEKESEMTIKDVREELIKNKNISKIKKEISELKTAIDQIQEIEEKNVYFENGEKIKDLDLAKLTEKIISAKLESEKNKNLDVENKNKISDLDFTVQDLSERFSKIQQEKDFFDINTNTENKIEKFSLLENEIKKLENLNLESYENIKKIDKEIEEIKKLKEKSIEKNNFQEEAIINQLNNIKENSNKNFDLMKEQTYDKNLELYSLWDINRNKINEVKTFQQAVSSDFIDNMEKLEDIQSEQNERTKLGSLRIERDLRQKIFNIGEKVAIINSGFVNIVLNTDLGKSVLSDSMGDLLVGESERIKEINENIDEKINQMNNKIENQIINNTNENLNELKNKIIINSDEKILNSKYDLKTKIDEVDVRTDIGIKELEEKEKIENGRLQSLVKGSANEVRNSADKKIEIIKSDIITKTGELSDQINEVNSSIEKRTEIVMERMGFRASTRRMFGKVGNKIMTSADSVGQNVGGRVAELKGKFVKLKVGESNVDDDDSERSIDINK